MKRYLQKVVFCSTGQDLLEAGESGVLYIAEDEWYLRQLREMELPVAVWLHEGNRQQDLSAAFYALENPHELDQDVFERIYRREKGIPWEVLETKRCLVREMIPGDAVAFAKIYQEQAVQKYMHDFHRDEAGERQYIQEYQQCYRFYEYGVWSIVLKETGEVIGRAGFMEPCTGQAEGIADGPEMWMPDEENGPPDGDTGRTGEEDGLLGEENGFSVEADETRLPRFGYLIGVPWQGQGLAYEVCSGLLQYAAEELGFEKVALEVESTNRRSLKLAKKLGFRETEEDCSSGKKLNLHKDASEDDSRIIQMVVSLNT